jgi:signal transduction histidine kinase
VADGPESSRLGSEIILDALTTDLLDSLPISIAVFDMTGGLRGYNLQWHEQMVERFHVSPGEIQPGLRLIGRFKESPRWLEALAESVQTQSPVAARGLDIEVDGLTGYYDVVWAPFWRDGEMAGVVQVVNDATERIRSLQLLEERVAERTAELDRRTEVSEGLRDILTILNSCCPSNEVMDYILAQAKRLLNSEVAGVYRLERDSGGIQTVGAHGIAQDQLLDITFPGAEGWVHDTIMQRKPMVVPDSTMLFGPITDRMLPEHRERIHDIFSRYRALLAIPLIVTDQVWGCLALYYFEPRQFSDEELSLAADLADHLALALENAELREQAEEAAASAERGRLARDLHDAVTQTLFSASLIAEVVPRIWRRDQDEALRRLDELRHLTRGALAEMRTLLLELRPAALVDADLGDVLRQLAEAAGTQGPAVGVVVEGEARRLVPDQQVALYRIAQEAVSNATKHAHATCVEISLRFEPEHVVLQIADDGTGFDASAVSGDHHGLRIMRERASAAKASLELTSSADTGTIVRVVCCEEEESGCAPCACS